MTHRLTNVVIINPSFPSRRNARGTIDLPAVRVGAVTLPLLAALVHRLRPDCSVRIYDEIATPVDLAHLDRCTRETTLVLMTALTTTAYEARAWSQRIQRMGFAVVIGGPHASAVPEEVAGYANAAVHGEAEVHLPAIIQAFEAGVLTRQTRPGLVFRSDATADLALSPKPEFHLYRYSRNYMQQCTLEFSRGCPYGCNFCASTNLYTRSVRHKTIGQVLAEIDALPVYPGGRRVWFFGDDNFASVHARAKELAHAIGRSFPRSFWGCAMTIASAADTSLLDALVAGGMRYAFVGFDSIVQESLDASNKRAARVKQFNSLIGDMKQRGIFIVAALVFGFDHDRPRVFADTLRWARDSGVDILNLNVVRPYPSSPVYTQLRNEERLLADPWWLEPYERRVEMVHGLTANLANVMTTYRPRHMTARDLTEGTLWVGQEFHSLRLALPRMMRNAGSLASLVVDGMTNHSYSRHFQSFVPVGDPARGERSEVAGKDKSSEDDYV
jgi:radical SAM superfamily enzyme YgiQ (UPF0313 family)